MQSYYLMGTEFRFGKMKKFWRQMTVMVAQHVNVLNASEQYFMVCTFYHNQREEGAGERERERGKGTEKQ